MTKDSILANVRRLLPELAAAPDLEEGRTLPAWVVARLKEAGCFRMCMPRSWGGPELTTLEQLEIIEALASVNASVAWCVMIGCDSGLYSGYLDDGVARELYGSLDAVQAGWVYPGGRAIETDGGYKVTGRWIFGSGIKHADVIGAGCLIYEHGSPRLDAEGRPEWIVVLGKQGDFDIEDNWDTTGLHGTGSHNYHVKGGFFPRAHSFSFRQPAQRDGLLWQRNDTFLRKMAAIPLGVCRAALDFTHGYLQERQDFNTRTPLRNSPIVQHKLAECELKHNAARAYLYRTLERQWRCLESGEVPDERLRADVWLSRVSAFRSSREVILALYDLVGGPAIRRGETPIERAMRDSLTWCQHLVGKESGYEAVGNLLLNGSVVEGFPML
ncbi:acyl-CoA dehydrogenase family protein [Massilia sp. YMA4]|uniref:acyl-CoA dehydrogenase family protein n=1 Tax=Massilia sp. YMA4 TaxID=1593482 RepID=UPI000DD156E0|nr:acyl-CoA dehydrogenase family protein [Massilia sp. YMA4]AXA92276.1 acyl-CoA dehydrogenase [Massilia sp. YMA4]